MGAIDVNVKAEPDSCRELAHWLAKLVKANRDAAAEATKASSSAESFWKGEAGENFATEMFKRGYDIDQITDAADRARSGLEVFADDIATVRKRMEGAMEHAREARLTITGTLIHQPPGSAASIAADGAGGDMPGLDPNRQLHANAQEKLEAYREIESVVYEERARERTAHKSLIKALDGSNTIVDAIASAPTWIGRAFVYAGTAHGAATKLAQEAKQQNTFAESFERLSANTTLPADVREQRLNQLFTGAGMKQRAADSNSRLLLNIGKTKAGDLVMRRLTGSFGGEANTRLNSAGRAFSVTAAVGAGFFTLQDMADGKPLGKSLWTNFGGLGVSTGASTAAETGLMAAGGTAGGPITATGLGVGFVTATAWTYFQDNDLHDLYRDMGGDHFNNPHDNADEYRQARFGR